MQRIRNPKAETIWQGAYKIAKSFYEDAKDDHVARNLATYITEYVKQERGK